MPEGAVLGVLLCALAIGFAIQTLIGAVVLRAAVTMYNKMVGGPSSPGSVPEPAFIKALWITFATSVAQLVVGLFILALMKEGNGPEAVERREHVVKFIYLPAGLLIMVGMLSAKLPTTFGRAVAVTLCEMLLVLIVTGALVAIVLLVLGISFPFDRALPR